MNMNLGEPQLDYVTISSYNLPRMRGLEAQLQCKFGYSEESGNVMQYRGRWYANGSIFFGETEIRSKWHGIIRVSGTQAERQNWLATLNGNGLKMTRCDIQISENCNAVDMLEVASFFRKKTQRKSGVVVSGEWDGTLYLGSRTSGKLVRISLKQLEGNELALRFEVEYKQKQADALRKMLSANQTKQTRTKAGLLLGELQKIPTTGEPEFDRIIEKMGEQCYAISAGKVFKPTVARTEKNTMVWLETQVTSAFNRLAREHDTDISRLEDWIFRLVRDLDESKN